MNDISSQRHERIGAPQFFFCYSAKWFFGSVFLAANAPAARLERASPDSQVPASVLPLHSAISFLYRSHKVHFALRNFQCAEEKICVGLPLCRSLGFRLAGSGCPRIGCMHQGESEQSNEKSLPHRSRRDPRKFSANVLWPCAGTGTWGHRFAPKYCNWVVRLPIANGRGAAMFTGCGRGCERSQGSVGAGGAFCRNAAECRLSAGDCRSRTPRPSAGGAPHSLHNGTFGGPSTSCLRRRAFRQGSRERHSRWPGYVDRELRGRR